MSHSQQDHATSISTSFVYTQLVINNRAFVQKKSTVNALLSAKDDWLETGADNGAVFFVLNKAFDTVPHRALLENLHLLALIST